ncbi:MAG: DUF21 domain-containing protein [Chitinivibrionales bacterium]|nr:DUF21 domain-containing protein [Chitinivibrionales bacterium]MBD3395283.1 DUF21 domain-containing protein [Chitinivibrionales bacterium]
MILLLIYLGLALSVSFFCSIMEAVLLSVNPPFVALLKKKKPSTGKALEKLKRDIDRPLAAILSLNTIAHTLGAAGVGAQAHALYGDQHVALISAVLTFLILVFSEIIPKTIGASYWRGMAGFATRSLQVMVVLMYPFVVLSRVLTRLLSKNRGAEGLRREEFNAQVELGVEQGLFEQQESRILKNLIRFNSLQAQDIMTPRTVIVAFEETTRLEEIGDRVEHLSVSRIPLYGESHDVVTGYVLKEDLLGALARNNTAVALRDFRRDIPILPDVLSLSSLFERLLEKQEHIAVLIDEYGGVSGLVTMEDVVETLLGLEIVDEQDAAIDMQAYARKRWQERAQRLGLIG